MGRTIPQRELRNDNARVLDAVAGGEDFVVTRNGIPIAHLTPIARPQRTFVPRAQLVALASRADRIDPVRFRDDLDERLEQGLTR